MQLWQYCLLVTAMLLYMFRTLRSEVGCHSCGNRPLTSLLDTYHPDQWHAPVAATTVFSAPDDGRR